MQGTNEQSKKTKGYSIRRPQSNFWYDPFGEKHIGDTKTLQTLPYEDLTQKGKIIKISDIWNLKRNKIFGLCFWLVQTIG